jgi:hypothetical protein
MKRISLEQGGSTHTLTISWCVCEIKIKSAMSPVGREYIILNENQNILMNNNLQHFSVSFSPSVSGGIRTHELRIASKVIYNCATGAHINIMISIAFKHAAI